MTNGPIIAPEAWRDGTIWLRDRSGPTPRSISRRVSVSMWHRIGGLSGSDSRPTTVCGYGPRNGFVWPAGGLRWEVARPGSYGSLPGPVCPRCLGRPVETEELEEYVADLPDLEVLAGLVAERLRGEGS